jgi:hypothetical protein
MSEPTAEDAVELRQEDVFDGNVSISSGAPAFTPMAIDHSTPQSPQPQRPNPLSQTPLHISPSSVEFDMPNLNTGVSTPINVPARIVEVNGSMKLIVDLPALFSNSRRGSDSASGDQQVGPKAKWPFGRFKAIQDGSCMMSG